MMTPSLRERKILREREGDKNTKREMIIRERGGARKRASGGGGGLSWHRWQCTDELWMAQLWHGVAMRALL